MEILKKIPQPILYLLLAGLLLLLYPALIYYLYDDELAPVVEVGFWIVCTGIVTILGIMLLKSQNKILPLIILSVFFIFLLSLILISKIYGSDFDLDPLNIVSRNYTFYSGARGGTYFEIGNSFTTATSKNNLKIKNDTTTSGSIANAMQVNADERAFGLVQEDFLNDGDVLSDNLKFVAPLYMERLHIICRKELLNTDRSIKNIPDSQVIELTDKKILGQLTMKTRKTRKLSINIGPAGSGNRLIASYILNEIEKKITEFDKGTPDYQTTGYGFLDMLRLIKRPYAEKPADSLVDIAFYLGASPQDSINKLLTQGNNYCLLSISPSFITALNKEYDLHLRITDFRKAYGCTAQNKCNAIYANISTLGTLAFLVTHKSTPKKHILQVLDNIHHNKGFINKELFPAYYKMDPEHDNPDSHNRHDCPFPLDEYDFYDYYKTKYNDTLNTTISAIMGLLVPVISVILIILKQLPYLFSLRKKWDFNKQIAEASKSTEKSLKDIRKKILEAYRNGELVESHYDALKTGIDDLVPG